MTLELFEQGPDVYIPVLAISLLVTLIAYGAYPLLYARLKKKPISKTKYKLKCWFFNFLPMLAFFLLSDRTPAGPYLLWTSIFCHSGLNTLERRNLLADPDTPVSSSETDMEYNGKYQQPAIPDSPKKTKYKNRFCKLCGSPIDPTTKKCTGCGKQYFRMTVLKKRGIIPKVVVVLSILILGLCVYRNVQYQKQITQMTTQIAEQNAALKSLQSELEAAKSDVSEIQDKYRAKFSEAYNLSQENNEMKRIYDYCEKNMVFVISKTYLYHKPHCFMIQGSEASFEGFTVSVAQQRGYTPCWLCCN